MLSWYVISDELIIQKKGRNMAAEMEMVRASFPQEAARAAHRRARRLRAATPGNR